MKLNFVPTKVIVCDGCVPDEYGQSEPMLIGKIEWDYMEDRYDFEMYRDIDLKDKRRGKIVYSNKQVSPSEPFIR